LQNDRIIHPDFLVFYRVYQAAQERLGHSDISLTLNTYFHVLPSMQEEAAEKMDEILISIDVSGDLKQVIEPKTR
jgi:integrase